MRDTDFDPADAACWIARGRRPDHAALIAAAWRDYPDLPPSAPLADRMARSRARIAAMNPVNEQIRLDHAREQEASNFAFTEGQIRQGRGSAQDTAILEGRDRHGYDWLRSVVYGQGWYAAQAGWDYRPPGPNLRGIVRAGTTEAYAQGFADGGGRRDDLFDAARRQFAAAGRVTAFIRQEGLLDPAEIDAIVAEAPADLLDFQRVAAAIPLDHRPTMGSWLERFHAGFDRLAA